MDLIDAARAGNLAEVTRLLEAGADVNAYGEGRTTALIEAARRGHLEVVKRLLAAGAEPRLEDELRETALLKAAAEGQRAVVSLLGPLSPQDERDTAIAF